MKFATKPTLVEAKQFTLESITRDETFIIDDGLGNSMLFIVYTDGKIKFLKRSDGTVDHVALIGDWVVLRPNANASRDVFFVRPEIFRQHFVSETGIQLITAERARQVSEEGWTEDHDDNHFAGELVDAAIVYADAAEAILRGERDMLSLRQYYMEKGVSKKWPWEEEWLKIETNPIDNLVKAGALIAAEIDRLKRLPQQGPPNDPPTMNAPHELPPTKEREPRSGTEGAIGG